MFKDLIPLRNEVKVRVIPQEEAKSEHGFIIPNYSNTFAEKLFKAKVVACGPEVERMGCNDIVVCQYHTGIEVAPDIIMIKETDIVGILEIKSCSGDCTC